MMKSFSLCFKSKSLLNTNLRKYSAVTPVTPEILANISIKNNQKNIELTTIGIDYKEAKKFK